MHTIQTLAQLNRSTQPSKKSSKTALTRSNPTPRVNSEKASAKIFTTGGSQAVRLPKAFRLECDEVWLHRQPVSQAIVLTPVPTEKEFAEFFAFMQSLPVLEEDFLLPRNDAPTPNRLADLLGE